MGNSVLRLPRACFEAMVAHARAALPHEACGLVLGRGSDVKRFLPTDNALRSAVRFAIPPADVLRALRLAERASLDLFGVFHSHPGSAPHPSAVDVTEALYPEALHLILSLAQPAAPALAAFRIRNGQVEPVAWRMRG